MDAINANLSSAMLQKSITEAVGNIFTHQNKVQGQGLNVVQDNAPAYSVAHGLVDGTFNFDSIMNKVANFNDMLCTTQDTMALMREQGEALLKLINRAHEEDCGEEELANINKEAASRVDEINKLYQGANFNGVNPFSEQFGITIPDWQNVVQQFSGSAPVAENTEKAITDLLTSVSFDCEINADFGGSSLNLKASADINIGFTEDGALQITVDASMDFDLSGIVEKGAQSDESLDLINNFLNLLNGKDNNMSAAGNFLQAILSNVGISLDDFVNEEGDENSKQLQGKIMQQAVITLDGPNQIPNIAINLL